MTDLDALDGGIDRVEQGGSRSRDSLLSFSNNLLYDCKLARIFKLKVLNQLVKDTLSVPRVKLDSSVVFITNGFQDQFSYRKYAYEIL